MGKSEKYGFFENYCSLRPEKWKVVDAKQLMKVCDYFRSRSSLDLGRSVVYKHFSKIFFSETAWPIKLKFYVEHPWVGVTKV